MRINRVNRISIDIDSKNQFNLLKIYYNMKNLFGNVDVTETKHGFHVSSWTEKRTTEQNLHIRRIMGDCKNRLELDENRLRFGLGDLTETLFYGKFIDGEWNYEQPYNIDSMPFWGLKIGRK